MQINNLQPSVSNSGATHCRQDLDRPSTNTPRSAIISTMGRSLKGGCLLACQPRQFDWVAQPVRADMTGHTLTLVVPTV